MERLQIVFNKLRKAGLKLKAKKGTLFAVQVEFLGHVVLAEGVSTDPKKTQSIKNWPVPTNLSEVRSFFAICLLLALCKYTQYHQTYKVYHPSLL